MDEDLPPSNLLFICFVPKAQRRKRYNNNPNLRVDHKLILLCMLFIYRYFPRFFRNPIAPSCHVICALRPKLCKFADYVEKA